MDELLNLLSKNISAVFALIGALAGAGISVIGTLLVNEKDLKLRLKEKVINHRIDAHEKVIQLSKSFRTMVSLGKADENGELMRYPAIMTSIETFDAWHLYFYEVTSSGSTWLSTEVTRELNFFQDYIINLREYLRGVKNEDNVKEIGAILRPDFISFSDRIEKIAFKYFERDLMRMSLGDLGQWHKFPMDVTKKRFESTTLFIEREKINSLIRSD